MLNFMFYFGAGERAQQLTMYGALTEYPSLILSTQVEWLTTACNPRSRKIRHLWSLFETIVTCTLFPCSCNWDKNIKTYSYLKWAYKIPVFHAGFSCLSLLSRLVLYLPASTFSMAPTSHPYYFFFQFVLVPLHPCLKVLVSNGPILSYPVFTHINYFLDTCIC